MPHEEEYRSLGPLDSNLWRDDVIAVHQGNGTCFFEFFWDLKKREKTDKSKKGLKATKVTATFLCWVDCLKKALLKIFKA
jgi:hypothetical protein